MSAPAPAPAGGGGPVARIDRSALAHNLAAVRRCAPRSRVLAVVKADAYGHGLVPAARALVRAGADGLAVARLGEALALRRAGVAGTVLVLAGWSDGESLERIAAEGLDAVLHERAQLEVLRARGGAAGGGPPVRVWLKADTGLHRLGFAPAEFPAVWRETAALPRVAAPLHAMTHFAAADDPGPGAADATARQSACFDGLLAALGSGGAPPPASLANSAAVLAAPGSHRDWVRPGIMLYGASPLAGGRGADHGLRPAMTLSAPLVAVRIVERGAAIGYGGTWTAPERMPLGVAGIGYGDGYPRHLPSGSPVLVAGRRAALAGRVSMDLAAIDLRPCPDARPGDPVTLWGEGLPVEEAAEAAGTVPHELFARLGPRVERVFA